MGPEFSFLTNVGNKPMGMPLATSAGMKKLFKPCGRTTCNMLSRAWNSISDTRRFNLLWKKTCGKNLIMCKPENCHISSNPLVLLTLRHDFARHGDTQHGVAEDLRARVKRGQAGGYARGAAQGLCEPSVWPLRTCARPP